MRKIFILMLAIWLPLATLSVKASPKADADSLEKDMEFMLYVSNLVHLQNKETIVWMLESNGWKRKAIFPNEGKDFSYEYNGERRITLIRDHDNDSTIDRILLYDLDTVDPIELGKYLVKFGYNYQTMESTVQRSRLTGLPYTHDTYYYIDAEKFRVMICTDKYSETASQQARETSCIIFAVPKEGTD